MAKTIEKINDGSGEVIGGYNKIETWNAKTIKELWSKAKFMQITQASLMESHPHDVLITNPGKNY